MPTNRPGYNTEYYHRRRKKILEKLGNACCICGEKKNLHICVKEKDIIYPNRGALNRLTEWQRYPQKFKILCEKCHYERLEEKTNL